MLSSTPLPWDDNPTDSNGHSHGEQNRIWSTLPPITLNESSYRPIIGSLRLFWEKAGGKLFHPPVILYTLTADAFATARLISAVAVFQVFLDAALSLWHQTSWIH
jgi:hypothetical protein